MRMFRWAVVAAVWAATAGAQDQRPLDAALRRGGIDPVFSVDQPAFVAVFELIPGRCVQQLFPRSGFQARSPVEPGEYLLSRPLRSGYGNQAWHASNPYARPMYLTDASGRVTSYYYTTAWSGMGDFAMTRTLLMVASRLPLNRVGAPESAEFWLQNVVGFRAISNVVAPSDRLLSDIVEAVLPLGARVDDVVVDMIEITDPSNMYDRRYASSSMQFVCPGGIVSVPAEFFFGAGVFRCPVIQSTVASTTPTTPTPPDPGDEDSFKLHPRRTPTPGDRAGSAAGAEDGFRLLQRRTPTPADREAFAPGAGDGFGLTPRARILVDAVAPVTYDAAGRRDADPTVRAWTPRTTNSGYAPDMSSDGYRRSSARNANYDGADGYSMSRSVRTRSPESGSSSGTSSPSSQASGSSSAAAVRPSPAPQPSVSQPSSGAAVHVAPPRPSGDGKPTP